MNDQRFFVFGAPKSGTTWLQRILNAHPSIACLGEGHFIESLATPIHAALLTYRNRMKTVAKLVYEDQPAYPELTDADIDGVIKQSIESILLTTPKSASSLWIGDKTPAYAVQLGGLNRLYPDAKLFHIVRDPRDTATSILNFSLRIDAFAGSSSDRARIKLIEAAIDRWRATITAVKSQSENLEGRLLELRYEDLHRSFNPTFERIVAHLSLETDPALTAWIERSTSFQVVSGGRKSGQAAPGAFHYSGTIGQFAQDLSEFEIEMIENQLAPLMSDYGYQPVEKLRQAAG